MRRPSAARTTLGFRPLVEASRANAARVECVPQVPTSAGPEVLLGRRPTTFGAPDAWAGSVDAFLFIQFVINNNGGLVVREGSHASIL
jgi:hypothetical protein